ncbi:MULTISPECIES: hypothetical protein [Haloarcula]|uniref:hypothetical protein n=1 Tax=Haloarcula TaxID=2237 RepID=UPI0023E87999|nr:hypothetical protein [Halomicroarcula sp. SHR3]
MRKQLGTVALAALFLPAGCGGAVSTDGPGTGEPPTPSPTESGTATQSVTQTPSSVDSSRVLAYTALNDEQQSAVRKATDGESTFVPNSSYIDDSAGYVSEDTPFRLHDYVRYENQTYEVEYVAGDTRATVLHLERTE